MIHLHAPESLRSVIFINIPRLVQHIEPPSGSRQADSLARELLVAGAGRERDRGPPVLEKEVRSTDLWRNPNYAIILNTEFVYIIGEPALVAEPVGS